MIQPSQEEIGFEHKGIGSILSQNRLTVPLNQREYSWEDEHVLDLFEDFGRAIDNKKLTYFLGTVVITRGEGDLPEVSDGQQRLATTSILISAIRDYFFQHNDTTRALSIETDFLKKIDRNTTEVVPQLRLNVDDNDFYVKYVLSKPDSPDREIQPTKESHKRIKRAAELAGKHIENILAAYTKDQLKTERLLEWLSFIQDKAEVILLRVSDHLNAFLMFETLNDRGLKVSQADLLKNHLLSLAGSRMLEGQQKWAEMLGILETIGEDDITLTYLHHLLITKHGPITAREVFDKIKSTIDSPTRALDFLHELADGANDYGALFNVQHKKWNDYPNNTRKHVLIIKNDLRITQIRPLMFSVLRYFPVKEAQIAFKLFVCWSVRFLVVGGRGGLLDRNYGIAAQKVTSGDFKTTKELASFLIDAILPNDALFQDAFSKIRISKSYLARYFLRALELEKKGCTDNPELVPNEDEQIINLEHIMPEKPGDQWPEIDPETASAYHHRVGNMVILQAKKNSMIGNSKFEIKKQILKDSAFLLTSDVAQKSDWGTKEINERQKQLAELAVQTWPLNVS
jgi:hypothetical protein